MVLYKIENTAFAYTMSSNVFSFFVRDDLFI